MVERRFSSDRPTVIAAPAARTSKTKGTVIAGYAAVFNREAMIGGLFVERIEPGAFTDVLDQNVIGCLNHDSNRLLARTKSGTLRLSQDARGLRYELDVNPRDPLAVSVAAQVERGDIDGSSFAFIVHPDDERWTHRPGKVQPLRTIYRVTRLIDVSPVTFPAYSQTSVYARDATMRGGVGIL